MSATPTFSVIVPTCGRPSLLATLASLAPQLGPGDELIVVRNDDAPWGHKARDEAITRAKGTHLWFMDDDDVATPDALETIRRYVTADPKSFHIFRMRNLDNGLITWDKPEPRHGEVGTPQMVPPNKRGKLGKWDGGGYSGDAHFLQSTIVARDDEAPVFHEEIVALIKPSS